MIKPYRIYIANRTKNNFLKVIGKANQVVRHHKPSKEEKGHFLSCMNSYLGTLKHYDTYRMRRTLLVGKLSGWWWNHTYLSGGVNKFVARTKLLQ